MREIWREPSGYEGVVLVSNKGRVFKLPQKGRKGTGRYSRDGHLLKQTKINTGYWCVDIWDVGTVKRELVHRLVAKAFVDNPHEYEIVNHKDEDKTNNNANNLEWCTQKYNSNYGSSPSRISSANGKSVVQFEKNGTKICVYDSIIDAQRKTGISNGSIGDVLHGRRKTAGGYLWEYAR